MFLLATTITLIILIFAGNYLIDLNSPKDVNEIVVGNKNYWKTKRIEFDKGLLLASIITFFIFRTIYGIVVDLDIADFLLNFFARGLILIYITMAIKLLHIICFYLIKTFQKGKSIDIKNKQVKVLYWTLALLPLPMLLIIDHLL